MLVIALAKGRFLAPSLELLGRAGIRFDPDVVGSRKLVFDSDDGTCRGILVKPIDAPTYVEYGAADLGIAGRDVLMETGADLLQPIELDFGHCRVAVAAPRESAGEVDRNRPALRVATKYPRITLDHFNGRGIPVEIIPLSGSIELAPLIGLADRIVDLVETGRTLEENGLEVVDTIAESSARLIINRASYQTKRKQIAEIIETLEKLR